MLSICAFYRNYIVLFIGLCGEVSSVNWLLFGIFTKINNLYTQKYLNQDDSQILTIAASKYVLCNSNGRVHLVHSD